MQNKSIFTCGLRHLDSTVSLEMLFLGHRMLGSSSSPDHYSNCWMRIGTFRTRNRLRISSPVRMEGNPRMAPGSNGDGALCDYACYVLK